ncbi:vitamin B12 ABC transporter ATP-binding protein BtuD [Phytobacter ursingii]|uniref:Vitamin B12 import ATP-binding protein BtuD n=2 Tax=Phytobacter ursingii TaxID=1972431 RepID=A0AB35RT25_9ENTR|nr:MULTISPECIES: vitamin B12 ABC transporter ATP-binding protein BtuD [Enterobacteriaceae]MDV2863147.1 vitamin B12 ABC transporter ATP-binding protein BtuD [Phytobacter ursingii]
MMPLLQLHALEEAGRLGPVTALVDNAQMLHLVGPNGAGKSTLLARIAGLTQGKGCVRLNDRPLAQWHAPQLARHRAYLAQQQTPPFAMPVWHYLSLHQHSNDSVVEQITHKLGLGDKLGRTVNQLSGGEWQRVRLAAVIAQIHPAANADGQLLLLDEPMNSLDVAQQAALDGILNELVAAGITVVMSSHDLNHSLRRAHQVWLLRQGKLIASGPRDEVLTPQNLALAYGMPFRRLDLAGHRMLIPEI